MQVTFLGTSGELTKDLATTSLLVNHGATSLLLDCGTGTLQRLLRELDDLSRLHAVIVTHSHADHAGDIPYLLFLAMRKQVHGLKIVASDKTMNAIRAAVSALYPDLWSRLNLVEISLSDDKVSHATLGTFELTAVPVDHSVPTLGVALRAGGRMLAVSSDTAYSPQFCAIARDADVLVHEALGTDEEVEIARRAKHSLASDAGRAAHACSARALYLSHYLPKYHLERGDELVRDASRSAPCPVHVARQGQRIDLA